MRSEIRKDITFIYMDSAERSMYRSIAEEAEKRGYVVRFSDNKLEKCEIGFYCQHVNLPHYSKFSVIMLHDIVQQFGNWPDIWYLEPWDKYDLGFLPSNQWERNWIDSSKYKYSRPRLGIYKAGWPKADVLSGVDLCEYRKQFCRDHGLDPQKKTILYAPSWENDGKQDDFVQAMLKLDVNIIIKQYNASEDLFPEVYHEIQRMNRLHEGIPEVKILDPAMNIFEAILAADVLVSEESSTMAEAAMVGIPAVSVSDWLIPDTKPSRLPVCHYEFAVITKKAELSSCVKDIIENYDAYKAKVMTFRDENFFNIGHAAEIIMDVLDAHLFGSGEVIDVPAITPQGNARQPFSREIRRKAIQLKIRLVYDWKEKYRVIGWLWNLLKGIKDRILKK